MVQEPLESAGDDATWRIQMRATPRPPDVYPLAAYAATRWGGSHVVDVGCGRASPLAPLPPGVHLIGLGCEPDITYCQAAYPFGRWIAWDPASADPIPLSPDVLADAVVVCAGVVDRLADPRGLLRRLRSCLEYAPLAILTAVAWNPAELRRLVESEGLRVGFEGLTRNDEDDAEKGTAIVILDNAHHLLIRPAPPDFRVVAVMRAYNEADIIVPSIARLVDQGIDVYLIDNWSTDATVALAERFLGRGLIGVERFPGEGHAQTFRNRELMRRVEEVSREIRADWFVHHDADERRSSPWPGVSLRDGIYHVDRSGFTAVDHTVIEFRPVDCGYTSGTDFEVYFRHFEFGQEAGHFLQIKAWKNLGPVSLARSGGHEAVFEGRRVYPWKFLLKHYPVRSQAHGERKVLVERKGRWDPVGRALGWHTHYDDVHEGHRFLRDPAELTLFDEEDFARRYLVERLSSVGLSVKVRAVDAAAMTPHRWSMGQVLVTLSVPAGADRDVDPTEPAIVAWSTADGSPGQVFVAMDDGPEKLFSEGPEGSQAVSWFRAGSTYRFRLYAGTERTVLLAMVTVSCEP